MSYLALHQNQLSCFSHHWFWGLRVNATGTNLYDAALGLQQDPGLRQSMEDNIKIIEKKSWISRSLHWLFNHNQYRSHYYQLQGYYSWQLYKTGETMFSKDELPTTYLAGVFLVIASSMLAKQLLAINNERLPSLWFSMRALSYFSKQTIRTSCSTILTPTPAVVWSPERAYDNRVNPLDNPVPNQEYLDDDSTSGTQNLSRRATLRDSSSNDDLERPITSSVPHEPKDHSFIVTSIMLEHLKTLGMTCQIQERISLETLKSLYKQACLKTHPDKTGINSQEAFTCVVEAYEQLLCLIEKKTSSGLWSELAKVREEIAEMRREREKMQAEKATMRAEKAVMREKVTEMIENVGLALKDSAERMAALDLRIAKSSKKAQRNKSTIEPQPLMTVLTPGQTAGSAPKDASKVVPVISVAVGEQHHTFFDASVKRTPSVQQQKISLNGGCCF